MSARGGERVGPPVPSVNEQQDGNKDRVRGKKEGDFAVGETKDPGDPRGSVIADSASQDPARGAGECPGACPWSGVRRGSKFAIRRRFAPCIGHLSRAASLAAGR